MPRSRTRYRNTPTGVGKTRTQERSSVGGRKHPHGRGEDLVGFRRTEHDWETPPRAWGRLTRGRMSAPHLRNTPTGVGKTDIFRSYVRQSWKHPHGRGEDSSGVEVIHPHRETPPRAWGRQKVVERGGVDGGNTPTGVGKTTPLAARWCDRRKHPHGRGEDNLCGVMVLATLETPPRAWGRRCLPTNKCGRVGNTPTGVGKT